MIRCLCWMAVLLFLLEPIQLIAQPIRGVHIVFTTPKQGAKLLTKVDDFVVRLSPFDRAGRLKTDRPVSEAEYLEFVGRNILAWTGPEQELVESALSTLAPELNRLRLPFPKRLYFVKSTGAEEGMQEYTRGQEIVLPAHALDPGKKALLAETLAHELFHVLSRSNPRLREQLYKTIGFEDCGEIRFPPSLVSLKLTNPDAPRNNHCIHLTLDGHPVWAVPILFSRSATYDVARQGEFFQYAKLAFLIVNRPGWPAHTRAVYVPANAMVQDPDRVNGFYEQVGQNTGNISHPEEILADNFRLLVLHKTDVPSPEVLRKISQVLGQY